MKSPFMAMIHEYSSMHLFRYEKNFLSPSFNEYLLSPSYEQGTQLGAWGETGDKINIPVLKELTVKWQRLMLN